MIVSVVVVSYVRDSGLKPYFSKRFIGKTKTNIKALQCSKLQFEKSFD